MCFSKWELCYVDAVGAKGASPSLADQLVRTKRRYVKTSPSLPPNPSCFPVSVQNVSVLINVRRQKARSRSEPSKITRPGLNGNALIIANRRSSAGLLFARCVRLVNRFSVNQFKPAKYIAHQGYEKASRFFSHFNPTAIVTCTALRGCLVCVALFSALFLRFRSIVPRRVPHSSNSSVS